MILGVIFVIVWLVVGLVMGVIVGSQNKPTDTDSTNNTEVKCDEACQQWETRRVETCRAKNQTTMFQAKADDTSSRLVVATAIHIGLVVSAVAAAFIPIVGQFIAIGIAAAAVIALGVVSALAGQLAAEDSALRQAKEIQRQAEQLESEARITLIQTCSSDKANECLNRSAPC